MIIERSASGWDSAHIENPDVVKGSFGYRGETYSYLMAYQGNDAKTEDNYSVGLAVAKDPLGEWTKVGETAVLSYDKTGYGSAFGIGEPSLVSFDKAGRSIFSILWGICIRRACTWPSSIVPISARSKAQGSPTR